jgi:CO/xanthine dehydrogenase Mo-binding subunit
MTASLIGAPLPRVDGRAKVTGRARYAADFNQPGQLYAVAVSATIGLGRIVGLDEAPVTRMPGVVAVISHLNAPRLAYNPHKGAIDPPRRASGCTSCRTTACASTGSRLRSSSLHPWTRRNAGRRGCA